MTQQILGKQKVKYISYKPELTEQNILSYRIIADFDDIKRMVIFLLLDLEEQLKFIQKK